ncbi:MAG: S9 family peptidase [Candidatus Bipolaricaulota bacterium]|nr:S9 family peptidase [Candidatus Bipolaricaulota bacterium]
MSTDQRRLLTAHDLYLFHLVSQPQISPCGDLVVYCEHSVDEKPEKKYAHLWAVSLLDGEPRQITYGKQSDTAPRFSPDGKMIAFLSNREDEKQSQIYLLPIDGGEARRLTDLKGTIESFSWSPDGAHLLLQFRAKDPEEIEREEDEAKKKLGAVCREITRVFYKEDGVGYLPHARRHLWVVDAKTGELRQITEGDVFDEWDPAWSPDGEKIVFCSNRADDPDLDPDAIDLYVLPASGGEIRRLPAPIGPKSSPSFSSDGRDIAYYGHEGKGEGWKNTRLWVVPANGEGEARCVTCAHDFDVSPWTINDMGSLPQVTPTWSKNGDEIYFQVAYHGNTVLKKATLDGVVSDVIDRDGVVGVFSFDREQERLVYFHGDMKDPGQVFLRDMIGGNERKLTRVNADLLNEIDLGEIEEVWFKGADENDVQGWIITPPGFDPGKKYASVLEIHGGPRVQYGNFFMHEFYYLAAQGNVVYFCNPRGGQGYGEEHSKAIWNDWGGADYDDLMAWVDYVSQRPYIDRDRMGVTGGSYGGYMTNWIIGHTDRFAAAVTQRSVSNLISMYGSSDFNWAFQEEFGNIPPWEDMENYWRQSPIRYIGNAKTPTLVIHSENDMRCPIEQGEQVFVGLKRLGVDTKMVRFPDEPHGLSRGGRTDRRIARLEQISDWFGRYLKE